MGNCETAAKRIPPSKAAPMNILTNGFFDTHKMVCLPPLRGFLSSSSLHPERSRWEMCRTGMENSWRKLHMHGSRELHACLWPFSFIIGLWVAVRIRVEFSLFKLFAEC